MGNEMVIARRYSSALDSCLQSEKEVDQAVAEINEFQELLNESEDLRSVLSSPFQQLTAKIGVLGAVVKKMKLSKSVGNFLKILLKNQRLDLLNSILTDFVRITDSRFGRGEARVYLAADLQESDQKKLKKGIEKMVGKKLELSFENDTTLLGGFVIQTENKIFDYSVKGQLERLEDLVEKMRIW
ncbi:ATP synthase F1 subunit delta [bacterium]|jgi:F-type H+-transporting ATPase subunit delta|nr:ATP synthase F1 subunit delta [bacterium]